MFVSNKRKDNQDFDLKSELGSRLLLFRLPFLFLFKFGQIAANLRLDELLKVAHGLQGRRCKHRLAANDREALFELIFFVDLDCQPVDAHCSKAFGEGFDL